MSAVADQAAVKEYISKYQLEDELSAAVNMAIKANSDNPFKLISDYLKTLADPESDDDRDDDDDDMMEEEEEAAMPATKPRGRRAQVMAVKVDIPADFKPPVYPKSPEIEAWLSEVMDSNKLMKMLSPSDRKQLMLALKEVTFNAGDKIIKQGDAGDNFYVLDQGVCDIHVEGKGSVMKAKKGIAFGELALLHNAPRAATVTAEDHVTAWALDILSFKSILMGKANNDADMQMKTLDGIELLKGLSKEDKQTICTSMREKVYKAGRMIICEGDEGNTFYIIAEGEVKCTKAASGATEVSRRLVAGDFFGELALLSADKRAATVTATTDSTVLMIDRGAFERVLGSLKGLQDASTQNRQ
jgi:cAMP-dependent protein kinase regulator